MRGRLGNGEKTDGDGGSEKRGERGRRRDRILSIPDPFAEVVRPNRELKGFQRVFLRAGERKTVTFELNEESLSYYHSDGRYFADGGEYIVYVGGNSSTQNQEKFYLKPISENDKG